MALSSTILNSKAKLLIRDCNNTVRVPGTRSKCVLCKSAWGPFVLSRPSKQTHLCTIADSKRESDASSQASSTFSFSNIQQLTLAGFVGLFGFAGANVDIEGPSSVTQAVGALAAIVAVHEAGHFFAARLQGIRVTKFSIGFGPPLWKYAGKEVEYSLRAIPIGGFVAFPDDDPDSDISPDDPDLLKNRSILQRALVISAGVLANIVFAYAILFTQVSTIGQAYSVLLPGVKVPEVVTASAAARAGLQNGDVILKIGDFVVPAASSQVSDVVGIIRESPGVKLQLTIERDGQQLQLPCSTDVSPTGEGRIGVHLYGNASVKHTLPKSPLDALAMTQADLTRIAGTVTDGLRNMVTKLNAGQLSGPVAIVAAGSQAARVDAAGIFQFAAILNVNLAIVNLLPLPGLDGGYLALLLIEAAAGRKLPAAVEKTVTASGVVMLMGLAVALLVRDTLNLF